MISAPRRAWQKASGVLPYAWAAWMQRAWFQLQRLTRAPAYREAVRLAREVLPPGHDERAAAVTALGLLTCSHFTGWRLRTLAGRSQQELARAVPIEGLDILRDLQAGRRGAVLVGSQFGAGLCVPLLLARFGYEVWSVEGMDHLARAGLGRVAGVRVLDLGPEGTFRLPLLNRVRTVLASGELVHIAGDAPGGRGGIAVPFRGRVRRFADGFAALAVLADVRAIPLFATLDLAGQIRVEILPPLADDAAGRDRRARIASLVRAYAGLLESRWARTPENLLAKQLITYLDLPHVDGRPGPRSAALHPGRL